MTTPRRLGMGLEALLGEPKPESIDPSANELEIDRIQPNPFQPRLEFDDEEIVSLAESIRRSGILQPVVVRPVNGHFELVAGERRLRASRLAGLSKVPALVRPVEDGRMLELALVENLQRRDLNPIEKAKAFRQLLTSHGWTQEELAAAVGLSRPAVANFMRLLDLPAEVQEAVSRGTLSMGHARALLGTSNASQQLKLLRRILAEDLPVRAVEKMVAGLAPGTPSNGSTARKDPYLEDLERRLADVFGTRVTLSPKKRGGTLTVEWYSDGEFAGILKRLGLA